jgi:hypothetical protein
VIDYLMRTFGEGGIGIAFIYCNYKEKADQTVKNLLASLLQQLIQRRRVIPNKVCLLYEQHISKGTWPSLADYSKLLHRELAACSRAFVIVDALDECDEANGTRGNLITSLLGLPPTTYVMVTPRHSLSIES